MKKYITVSCPGCGEVIEIDVQGGAVVRHHPQARPKPGEDFLKERLRSLEEDRGRRESIVSAGKEREKRRRGEHEDLFKKIRDKSKDPTPPERPVRDIDLD